MTILKAVSVLTVIYLWLVGQTVSAAFASAKEDTASHKDEFFQVACIIMTDEEIEIYRNLPDIKEKEKFIDDFWKKRDPSPGTDENESRDEFYRRVDCATKWFKESTRGDGWNTERGRILLQLGIPDERKLDEYIPSHQRGALLVNRMWGETWTYYRYDLVLNFINDGASSPRLRLNHIPDELSAALKAARYTMGLTGNKVLKDYFEFESSYKDDHFLFTIPVKKINFEEKGDCMAADFQVTVYVYRDKKKVDEITTPKTISLNKEELLKMSNIEIQMPYPLSEKGNYFFDVIIEEKATASKSRDYIKY